MTALARFPIARADIETIVSAFYKRVRQDSILGPVFAQHVTDWDAHEAKITLFWANAILMERNYSGNPMQVHAAAANVHADHFTHWLSLFDEVLEDHLPTDIAKSWSALAHRIGRGLRLGLSYTRPSDTAPPILGEHAPSQRP